MSILDCCLAVEKERDGKPFTVCEVGTWFYLELRMIEDQDVVARNAAKLYDLFGNGNDKTERGITLAELKELPSNGGISIIPKTKDKFIEIENWDL